MQKYRCPANLLACIGVDAIGHGELDRQTHDIDHIHFLRVETVEHHAMIPRHCGDQPILFLLSASVISARATPINVSIAFLAAKGSRTRIASKTSWCF